MLLDLHDHLRSEPPSAAELTRRYVETGKRPDVERRKALSARSVQYAHTVAQMAFSHAVEDGDLAVAPTAAVPRTARPKLRRDDQPDMLTWDATETRTFLAAVTDPLWHALFAVALDTGMRPGELLALRCDAVDLERATLSVRRSRVQIGAEVVESSPKTKASRRAVQAAPGTVELLRKWRTTWCRNRLRAGEAWERADKPTGDGYVFVDNLGRALLPDAASGAFDRWVAAAGVKRLRFHDLRHTSATLDLAAGVHPKIVQEKLGHSSIAITLDLYSHVGEGMGAAAAELRGQLLYRTPEQ
jgi:integrase